MIAHVAPDIILLTNVDYDAGLIAAAALQSRMADLGHALPHAFAYRPNTGIQTGFDIDGNGYASGPDDAQGYGTFSGQGGMLILSRFPVLPDQSRDFSDFLWADLPGSQSTDPAELAAVQRLASTGIWSITIDTPDAPLSLLAWHAGTPAFGDGTGRNIRRNADENLFWVHYLSGELDLPRPEAFVLLGTANLDPADGLGQRKAISQLLSHPALQDPRPSSRGAAQKSQTDGGANLSHKGDPSLDTADWRDAPDPGNLRVQYILPAAHLKTEGAGVFWPAPDEPSYALTSGRDPSRSWHGLVWVDLIWQ